MKKLLVAVMMLAMVALTISGASAQGKISFGVGADVALPIGSFGDTQNIGIGGTAKVYYPVNNMLSLTGTAGYMTFGGKEITSIGGTKIKAGSWNMVPVVVGGRYYFGPEGGTRFYGGVDLGIIFGSYTVNTPEIKVGNIVVVPASSASASTTDFTYQPQIGVEAGALDIAVRLLGVSNANSIAARIGYIFGR